MIDGVKGFNVQADIDTDRKNIDGINFTKNNIGSYWMNGSLHKYHNQGKDNADDFRYTDLISTLYRLAEELAINPEITQLSRVEFGVNIKLPDPNGTTDSVILFRNNTGEVNKLGRFFEFSNYVFKVYRKDDDVLRVEVKVNRLQHLKQKGILISTLSDLLNKSVLNGLKRVLMDTFKDCMIIHVPEKNLRELNDTDARRYAEYTNPLFWNKIQRDKKKNFTREKNRCEIFIESIGGTDLKKKLLDQIEDKCNYLLNFSDGESVEFFPLLNKQRNAEVSSFSYLDNTGNFRQSPPNDEPLRCAGCGAIIPNPSKGQKFCSAKVVGYENAHRCRNNISNPRNNAKRSINRVLSIPLFFDLSEMIAEDKLQFLEEVSNEMNDIKRDEARAGYFDTIPISV